MPARKAVVFDFDGVLADSMPQHWEAYRRVLEPFGIPVSKDDVYTREGARSESIIRSLLGEQADELGAERVKALGNEKQRIFVGLGEVQLYPDARDLVRGVRPHAAGLGLVTGTRRVNLDRWAADLVPLFDAILAQESYTKDKPHPEPYEKAFRALGLDPSDCLVLENAVRGVKSAVAAGAGAVVGITTTMPRDALKEAGAHDIVADHVEAKRVILEWLDAPASRD